MMRKKKVNILLDELLNYKNKPFPSHIDDQFAKLAERRIKSDPLGYFLTLPSKRIFNFWLNLNAGYGLPSFGVKLSNKERLDLVNGGFKQKFLLLINIHLLF